MLTIRVTSASATTIRTSIRPLHCAGDWPAIRGSDLCHSASRGSHSARSRGAAATAGARRAACGVRCVAFVVRCGCFRRAMPRRWLSIEAPALFPKRLAGTRLRLPSFRRRHTVRRSVDTRPTARSRARGRTARACLYAWAMEPRSAHGLTSYVWPHITC